MSRGLTATAQVSISANAARVWRALTDAREIKQYMIGADVAADWKEGGAIVWRVEVEGKHYQDKGTVLRIQENEYLQYNHFSPQSGKEDKASNYHTVTIILAEGARETTVELIQDNNETVEERDESEKNWRKMLAGLKRVVETTAGGNCV